MLTWDPRGFGQSNGTIEVDSAAAEGRDVQRIIDWVAAQPGVQLDAPGDPRVGMVGASYGGGIQLVTAAIDCRVDAIVPSWAWHSLTTSLDKAATPKTGWSTLLYAVARAASSTPTSSRPAVRVDRHGVLDAADAAWFAERGPGDLVNKIRVPTLFVQGTVDTLFTLDEAVENYRILRKHNVPTAMIWYCGGHGVCLTDAGRPRQVARKTLAVARPLREARHARRRSRPASSSSTRTARATRPTTTRSPRARRSPPTARARSPSRPKAVPAPRTRPPTTPTSWRRSSGRSRRPRRRPRSTSP